jgi:hypothetical protein
MIATLDPKYMEVTLDIHNYIEKIFGVKKKMIIPSAESGAV